MNHLHFAGRGRGVPGSVLHRALRGEGQDGPSELQFAPKWSIFTFNLHHFTFLTDSEFGIIRIRILKFVGNEQFVELTINESNQTIFSYF